jgi:hypothetical protein
VLELFDVLKLSELFGGVFALQHLHNGVQHVREPVFFLLRLLDLLGAGR